MPDFDYKDCMHHASVDDPQYEILSDRIDHVATCAGGGLTEITPARPYVGMGIRPLSCTQPRYGPPPTRGALPGLFVRVELSGYRLTDSRCPCVSLPNTGYTRAKLYASSGLPSGLHYFRKKQEASRTSSNKFSLPLAFTLFA